VTGPFEVTPPIVSIALSSSVRRRPPAQTLFSEVLQSKDDADGSADHNPTLPFSFPLDVSSCDQVSVVRGSAGAAQS
jgi:hypothetical protein